MKKVIDIISGSILEEEPEMNLDELCECCQVSTEVVLKFIEYGVINPCEGNSPEHWRFHQSVQIRTDKAIRLKRDLGINVSGVALTLELLDEIEELKSQLSHLSHINQTEHFD
ncbi:MAG: chaperone modulatory protein CbpM [Cocleimonas sp.]|jgi:chaperone modulatory protein CbpM